MKRLSFLIISAVFLVASDRSPKITKYSDLTISQKKNVALRIQKHKKLKGLRNTAKRENLSKLSPKKYNQLRNEFRFGDRIKNDSYSSILKSIPSGNDKKQEINSLSVSDQDFFGVWEQDDISEGIFIELSSSITIPNLDQVVGKDAASGGVDVFGDASEGEELIYLYAPSYTFGGQFVLSNEPWFDAIEEGDIVYDLAFYYGDESIDSWESYIDYMKNVNLKYPTSGSISYYEWGGEGINIWAPIGGGYVPEGSLEFYSGILSIAFDGTGGFTSINTLDPDEPDTDTYTVADDGSITFGGDEDPIAMLTPDASAMGFLQGDDQSGTIGIGFQLPFSVDEGSIEGNYFGVALFMDEIEILGNDYEFPRIQTYSANYDGSGNYSITPIAGFESDETTTGTYSVDENGLIVADDGEGPIGLISSDSLYGVFAQYLEDDDAPIVGLHVKESSDKSASSLDGTFAWTQFGVEARVGLEIEINSGFYNGIITFDGAGNYEVIDDETNSGQYDVTSTGVLIIDEEEVGFVGGKNDLIIFGNVFQDGLDLEGVMGIAIKQSSGLSNASLAGNYGAAFAGFSSESDFEEIYVEDHVTLDFLGNNDSIVNASIGRVYIDPEYGDTVGVDLRLPPIMGVDISELEVNAYYYDDEEDYEEEFHWVFDGNIVYEKETLPSGEEIELPSIYSDWEEDEDDIEARSLEFHGSNLGKEIISYYYSWVDDEGNTIDEEWVDTTKFAWKADDKTLTVLMPSYEWDDETGDGFDSYEKMTIPYEIDGTSMTLGGDFLPCDNWGENEWYENWEQCIQNEYPILSVALGLIGEGVEDFYGVNEEYFTYSGVIPPKKTKASTLPLEIKLPEIMDEVVISGNRLYGMDYDWVNSTDDPGNAILKIFDITNPEQPKELDSYNTGIPLYNRPDIIVKDNVLITNEMDGPNFYTVSKDKILPATKGNALTFDGNDDYVNMGAVATNFNEADFSIQVWVNTKTLRGEGLVVKSDGDESWESGEKALYIHSSGFPYFVGYSNEYIFGSMKVNDGKWHHIVVTWDYTTGAAGTANMYVDGTASGLTHTYAAATADIAGHNIYVGAPNYESAEAPNYFTGQLKDVAIWSQALTPANVTSLYNDGVGNTLASAGLTSNLLGSWTFNEGSGSAITDASNYGNNGTIMGGAKWSDSKVSNISGNTYGMRMALNGDKLYVPSETGFRIINVADPLQPYLIETVDLGLTDANKENGITTGSVYFSDMKVTDSHLFLLDYWSGPRTDACEDYHALRIVETSNPSGTQIEHYLPEQANTIEVHGNFLYAMGCENLIIYDISDVNNITEHSKVNLPVDTYTSMDFGEIEKVNNFLYVALGGNKWWGNTGLDIYDVTHHANAVHVASIPEGRGKYGWDKDGNWIEPASTEWPVSNVEVSSTGHIFMPEFGFDNLPSDSTDYYRGGGLSVYSSNFGPQSFSLVFPPDGMKIDITPENVWEDTIVFVWDEAVDLEGSDIRYHHEVTGDLEKFFLISSNMSENHWTIPLNHLKKYMDDANIAEATGTWNIWATDGASNIWSANGPFELTINAKGLSIANGSLIPGNFALHNNYPNPFNPSTKIRYDIPENGIVSLTIYDLAGRKVRELVNKNQNAGFHLAVWDGTNDYGKSLSTGVYIYQIRSGSFVQSKKMLFMK